MDSETAQTILVIFLSAALAVFLTLAVILTIKTIALINTLKRIADKAEQLADKAEHIGEVFQKTAGPLAIGRFFTHLADSVLKRDKSNSGREKR